MNLALQASGVGKRYQRPRADGRNEDFWALNNINFDVRVGEVVGIIGNNGAGKSTMLKILSRITAPTTGEIRLQGRVGSLLEVGTGFHPELSGRENVFLNGAILGMGKVEVRRKFDDIVAFSGVGSFIDMPVKRYSSGMYMRLAFAVAAHFEPEILIVDEVLAVGDADFQKKSLGKMEDVAGHGRTVLFVSHNMNAIRQLCRRVIWLEGGMIQVDSSDVSAVTAQYLFGGQQGSIKGYWTVPTDPGLETPYFNLLGFGLVDGYGAPVNRPTANDDALEFEIVVDIKQVHPALNFGYVLVDAKGQQVYWTTTTDLAQEDWPDMGLGRRVFRSAVPRRLLNEGEYRLELFASLHAQGYLSEPGKTQHAVTLHVSGGMSDSPYWRDARYGVLAPVISWRAWQQ